ncbi:hypothetical protein GEMRC1_006992 [Eukaryota sp. GEM-RC1]
MGRRKSNKKSPEEELEEEETEELEELSLEPIDRHAMQIEALQSEIDIVLTQRRSATRTAVIHSITTKLTSSYLAEALIDRTFSLSQLCKREFKKRTVDTEPLLRLCQAVCITLFTDAEEFVVNCIDDIKALTEEQSPHFHYNAFQALATAISFVVVDDQVIEDTLVWCQRVCISQGMSYNNNGPLLVLSALAITVPARCIPFFPQLCGFLDHPEVAVQNSASTVIAILAEYLTRVSRRHDIPSQCVVKLQEVLEQSHRRVAKDDRLDRKRHITAVLDTIETGNALISQ